MGKSKCLNAAKNCATLMLVLCCLCAMANMPVAYAEPVQIPEPSEEYKKGRALQDEWQEEEARLIFETGAQKGDAWCMVALSQYYMWGTGGLQKDEERALDLMNKAAALNLPEAYSALGAYYLGTDYGVPKNTQKGLEFITKAAELGDSIAICDLASYYLEGKYGVPQNDEKGLEYLKKAAEQNNFVALRDLGLAYLDGNYGLPKNIDKAAELITKASKLNAATENEEAYFSSVNELTDIAERYLEGNGVPTNIKTGIEFLMKSAALDHPGANYQLGIYYENGDYVEQNCKTALAYYKKAKELGWEELGIDDKIKKLTRLVAE